MELAASRSQVKAPDGQKHCYDCATTQDVASFSKDKSRSDGLNPYCRPCAKARYDRWVAANPAKVKEITRRGYQKNKAKVNARNQANRAARCAEMVARFKASPCMDCRQSFPSYVMDFDHRPGVEKSFILAGHRIARYSLDAVLAEIAKCDLVCSNCHRMRTHRRRCEGKGEQ